MDPIEEIEKIKEWIKEFLIANEQWHEIDKNKILAVKAAFSLDSEQEANANAVIAKEDIYLSQLDKWREDLGIQ